MASQGMYTYGSQYAGQNFDVEAGQQAAQNFSEKAIRMGFIRKVFGILTVQLFITVGVAVPFIAVDTVRDYVGKSPWLLGVMVVLSFGLLITLVCCENPRRRVPLNYILLFSFTIVEGCLIGVIAAYSDIGAVVAAFGITAFVVLGLTLFALQTKYDFTMMGGVLLAILIAVLVGSIIGAIFFRGGQSGKIYHLVIACIAVVLFSAYLIYDVQLMVGGRHKYSIGVDEYVFASLNLYLDIINLFLYILQIINISGDL